MTGAVFNKINAEDVRERLKDAGLRPTKQRMQLAALLWSQGCRHVTAEGLHRESGEADVKVSLATIYNTLHQFTSHQLLREVVVDRGCSYFDTNTEAHHHFLNTDTGELEDIPRDMVSVKSLATAPEGMQVDTVDVIIRVSKNDAEKRKSALQ